MRHRHRTASLPAAALLAAATWVWAAAPAASAQVDAGIVLFSGDRTPGSDDLFNFRTLAVPLNNAGQVGIGSDFVGPGGDNGLFLGSLSGVVPVARSGRTLPSTRALVDVIGGGGLTLNDSGVLGVKAVLGRGGDLAGSDNGVLSASAGGPVEVAAQGRPGPSGSGDLFFRIGQPVNVNAAGQLFFSAGLFGDGVTSGTDEAIFRSDASGGGLTQLVRKGQATPDGTGTLSGTTFQASEAFATPAYNARGSAAFVADVRGTTFSDAGIFRYDDEGPGEGRLTQIAREGQVYTGGSGTLQNLPATAPSLNDAGLVAFAASTNGNTSLEGVFVSDGGVVRRVAGFGTEVAGGDSLRSIRGGVDLNNRGDVLFATAGNGFTSGVFLAEAGGGIVRLASEGLALPGEDGSFTGVTDYSLNEAGQVAFSATTTAGSGLYLYDADAGVTEILRNGGAWLGSTVTGFGFAGALRDEASGLNDRGQVAFSFQLADGRAGLAISPVVPEPATAALAAAGLLLAVRRRRG